MLLPAAAPAGLELSSLLSRPGGTGPGAEIGEEKMVRRAGLLVGTILVGLAWGAAGAAAQERGTEGLPSEAVLEVTEEHTTAVLPEMGPHWVFVLDPVFPHLIAAKVYILDGDSLRYLGMLNTGYVPNMAISPDHRTIYSAETYYSRGTRGKRTDIVAYYDARTLEPVAETVLPEGRFLVVPKKPNLALTPDGRYLLSYNMAPGTSVSVVDVVARRYVTDIEVPGCGLVFPTGNTSFSMLCPDGSFVHVRFDSAGNAEVRPGAPFFDPEEDPVFEHGVVSHRDRRAFFVSYEGLVYEAEVSDAGLRIAGKWSLLGEEDRAENWRPGGWQLLAYHAASDRLFVLMHRGGKWTHKQAGEEVWVFDANSHERVARVPLEHHAISVSVSQDDAPLLFTLSEEASLSVFDATSFEPRGTVEGLGDSPFLLYVADE